MNSIGFTVFYSLRGEQHQDIIHLDCEEGMSLDAVIESNSLDIQDYIVDKFQDFYSDVMSQGGATMNPDGIYIYDDVYDAIYNSAYHYLADHAEELEMLLIDSRSGAKTPINVNDYFKEIITDRAQCEACLVDISEAISYDSVDFAMNGNWQSGLITWDGEQQLPALWFGHVGSAPMRRWTITPGISPDDYSFWFMATDEDMLEAIVDDFDSIGTWYLYECGCEVPELTALIRRCPVKFEKDDPPEVIREKITSYVLSTQGANTHESN